MFSKLKESLKRLEDSNEFNNWKSKNKKSYFCSAFVMGADLEKENWQLDFYNPEKDKITSFKLNGCIEVLEEEGIFKKPKEKVNELKLNKVKIDFDKAIEIFEDFKSKKYPSEDPEKKIVILQNLKNTVWNITYICTSFNILNIKINAITGSVEQDTITSIFNFKVKDKK